MSKRIAGLCLLSIVAATSAQVFCRYVLNSPLPWPEEFSRLMFVILTYCGSLLLPEFREHIAIEVFYDMLPKPTRIALDIFNNLVACIFFGFLAVSSWQLTDVMAGVLMPALQLPTNIMFWAIVIAATGQTYIYLEALILQIWAVSTARPAAIDTRQASSGQWE